jgi:hypothetical protein
VPVLAAWEAGVHVSTTTSVAICVVMFAINVALYAMVGMWWNLAAAVFIAVGTAVFLLLIVSEGWRP